MQHQFQQITSCLKAMEVYLYIYMWEDEKKKGKRREQCSDIDVTQITTVNKKLYIRITI